VVTPAKIVRRLPAVAATLGLVGGLSIAAAAAPAQASTNLLVSASCSRFFPGEVVCFGGVAGGTPPYTYQWSNGIFSQDTFIFCTPGQFGFISLSVTDAVGDSGSTLTSYFC
jgi:hypothetical protein